MKIVEGIPPKGKYDIVAIDLEVVGAKRNQLHRPYGEFALASIAVGKEVYVIRKLSDLEKALMRVDNAMWVFQNANFDVPHIRRWVDIDDRPIDKFWDTLIVERILYNGYYDDFDLRAMARRYLNIILKKEIRKGFYDEGAAVTNEMVKYGAMDAYATRHIAPLQMMLLDQSPDAKKVWEWIDGPVFWAIQAQKGFKLNLRKWDALADKNAAIALEIKESLGFNPASPKQTLNALRENGIHVASTGAEILVHYRESKLVQKILEFRKAQKLTTTYGKNFHDVVEKDGRVYTDISVNKAITGRTASSGPNLQNQPHDPEFRACYEADKGNVIVKVDFSSQEPRISAILSQDKGLLDIFSTGKDLYLTVARAIYKDPNLKFTSKDDPLRRRAKAVTLGTNYGLQPEGLAEREEIELIEATILIDSYLRAFSGLSSWMKQTQILAAKNEYVKTPGGRTVHINPYMRNWANVAINAPIQGGGADQIKRAMIRIYEKTGRRKFPIIAPIHDELIGECSRKEGPATKNLISKCMIDAFVDIVGNQIPCEVEAIIGKNWAGEKV